LYGADFVARNSITLLAWAAGCLALSTFTLLPVIKVENANTVTAGGLLMLATGVGYLIFEQQITSQSRSARTVSGKTNSLSRLIMGLQLGVISLTIIVTRSSIASLQAKKGLPLGNQVIGWFCLISSVTLPFAHRLAPNSHYLHRLMIIFLTFAPAFILLTISYEGLFYFAFGATLLTWVRLEHAIYVFHSKPTSQHSKQNGTVINSTTSTNADLIPRKTHRTMTIADFRTSLFFFFLLQSAFFSTGNIASISSFSLDAVYRLIPIFDPFSQGALLVYKIMIPFAMISAALGILNRRVGLQSSALLMVVIAISDIMTLNFFWTVRDEGSWLEIGTTITNFVIASMLGVFVAALEGLSEVLIRGVEVEATDFEGDLKKQGVELVGNGTVKKASEKDRLVIE
jgi:GPI ethanolamine phosphate transferase 1